MYPREHLEHLAKQHKLQLTERAIENNLVEVEVVRSDSDEKPFKAIFDQRGQLWGLDVDQFNLDRFNNSEFSNQDINAALTSLVEGKVRIVPKGIFRRPALEIPLEKESYYSRRKPFTSNRTIW